MTESIQMEMLQALVDERCMVSSSGRGTFSFRSGDVNLRVRGILVSIDNELVKNMDRGYFSVDRVRELENGRVEVQLSS